MVLQYASLVFPILVMWCQHEIDFQTSTEACLTLTIEEYFPMPFLYFLTHFIFAEIKSFYMILIFYVIFNKNFSEHFARLINSKNVKVRRSLKPA